MKAWWLLFEQQEWIDRFFGIVYTMKRKRIVVDDTKNEISVRACCKVAL